MRCSLTILCCRVRPLDSFLRLRGMGMGHRYTKHLRALRTNSCIAFLRVIDLLST
jgi:hypothetical protein